MNPLRRIATVTDADTTKKHRDSRLSENEIEAGSQPYCRI